MLSSSIVLVSISHRTFHLNWLNYIFKYYYSCKTDDSLSNRPPLHEANGVRGDGESKYISTLVVDRDTFAKY